MPFHRITHHPKFRFATLHHYGCTFRCPFCSYKLRSGADGTPGLSFPKPSRFLAVPAIEAALRGVEIDKIYFMGGEPTIDPDLPALLRFAKEELNCATRLGHTNGSRLPLAHLDGANVGFKAFTPELHRRITGFDRETIYRNFAAAFDAGLDLAANMIYIPGLVELDEFEALMKFLRRLSPEIPFHIMGYIPVPGQAFRRPDEDEMAAVLALCRSYLATVGSSHLTATEATDLAARDDRFQVETVAGE